MAIAKNAIPFHALRAKDIAQAFCVTDRTVRTWVADGCPINADRTYSLHNVHMWILTKEVSKYKDSAPNGDLKDKKTAKEIELLVERIDAQKIENEELRKNTVSKYLYNRAVSVICEAFSKFLVDVIKRNIKKLRAIKDDELPEAIDQLGIQATRHMKQAARRIEQTES